MHDLDFKTCFQICNSQKPKALCNGVHFNSIIISSFCFLKYQSWGNSSHGFFGCLLYECHLCWGYTLVQNYHEIRSYDILALVKRKMHLLAVLDTKINSGEMELRWISIKIRFLGHHKCCCCIDWLVNTTATVPCWTRPVLCKLLAPMIYKLSQLGQVRTIKKKFTDYVKPRKPTSQVQDWQTGICLGQKHSSAARLSLRVSWLLLQVDIIQNSPVLLINVSKVPPQQKKNKNIIVDTTL